MNTHVCATKPCHNPATVLMVQRRGTSALFQDGAALICASCVKNYEDRAIGVKLNRGERRHLGW